MKTYDVNGCSYNQDEIQEVYCEQCGTNIQDSVHEFFGNQYGNFNCKDAECVQQYIDEHDLVYVEEIGVACEDCDTECEADDSDFDDFKNHLEDYGCCEECLEIQEA